MITTKKRAMLKKVAHNYEPSVQIGKEGLTQAVINQIDVELENRELIKIKLLKTSGESSKTIINELAGVLKAEPILSVGGVIVLYRFSNKKGVKHIEF